MAMEGGLGRERLVILFVTIELRRCKSLILTVFMGLHLQGKKLIDLIKLSGLPTTLLFMW